MSERTISQHFEHVLKAPLVNINWSWGSQRSDGTIFLRCGDDDFKFKNGRHYITVYYDDAENKPGRVERRRHIDLIDNGARAFIVCYKASFKKNIESIVGYDEEFVWRVEGLNFADNKDIQVVSSTKLRVSEMA